MAGARANDLWVFGYGSLMWRPGFAYAERQRATLTGYRRCFCIYSVHHRGTPRRPGLVLGLDRGGRCDGVVYRIAEGEASAVLAYLREREQINGVYRQTRVGLTLPDGIGGDMVDAVTFIAEPAHPSYAGRLSVHVQARLIRAAAGRSGPNLDYLASTLEHLAELGIRERELERVSVLASVAMARGAAADRSARVTGLARTLSATGVRVRLLTPSQRRRFVYRLNGVGG